MACEIGEINVTSGEGAGEAGGSSSTSGSSSDGEDGSTGTADGYTSVVGTDSTGSGSTTGMAPACEQFPETTGEACGCEDALLGSHDWWFSGCCTAPFGTCSGWCSDHGFGECLMVAIAESATCDPSAQEIHLDLCETDPWAGVQGALGVICICDAA